MRQNLQITVLLATLAAFVLYPVAAQEEPIPDSNRAELRDPPPRPPIGDFDARMRLVFDAVVSNQPTSADAAFLPRGAFRRIKGIANPDQYYDRLLRAFHNDISELHQSRSWAGAEFVGVEFSRRRSWVRLREEANRLPYWAQRHNRVVYRVGAVTQAFELRVAIAWGPMWYVTHLSEFR